MSADTLLDSDILSAILRNERLVVERARDYLATHTQLMFSLITRYEILRGLKAKGATSQLARFEIFCAGCLVLPLTGEIVERASAIYADLYRTGTLIGDADILIAATALHHNLALSTNNEGPFPADYRTAHRKLDVAGLDWLPRKRLTTDVAYRFASASSANWLFASCL